jgi:cell division septum initiation protein DivIVA
LALLDKLLQKIETILTKQKELEAENFRLKEEIRLLKQTEEIRRSIKIEQEENIQELASRLEKLLSA